MLSCLLQEQRLVFFSADWARLTLVAESLLLYLQVGGEGTLYLAVALILFSFLFYAEILKKTLCSVHRSDFSSVFRCVQPLSWQQPYVPVLSGGMLDFLMAPTAFLMGCHISHFEEVAAVSTAIHRLKLQTVSSLSNQVFLAHGDGTSCGSLAFWVSLISVSYPNSRSSYSVVF